MPTRDVAVLDAFADAPSEGLAVGIVPDGAALADNQRAAVARELAPDVTAVVERGPEASDDGASGVGEDATTDDADLALALAGHRRDLEARVRATIAALAWFDDRAALAAGDVTVDVGVGGRTATLHEDGTVGVDLPAPSVEASLADAGDAAAALGVDPAALRDVGADLPVATVDLGQRLLAVPVNYFEHVSGAAPDAGAIADLRARTGADRVLAYTFDALDRDNLAHAVALAPGTGRGAPAAGAADPTAASGHRDAGDGGSGEASAGESGAGESGSRDADGNERGTDASGSRSGDGTALASVGATGAAAVATVARRYGAVEGTDPLAVETGHFEERPAVISVDTDGHDVAVRGSARVTLTGEVALPAVEDDEIIEV